MFCSWLQFEYDYLQNLISKLALTDLTRVVKEFPKILDFYQFLMIRKKRNSYAFSKIVFLEH